MDPNNLEEVLMLAEAAHYITKKRKKFIDEMCKDEENQIIGISMINGKMRRLICDAENKIIREINERLTEL